MWKLLGPAGMAAVLVVLWVVNCSGPRPEVTGVELREPEQEGDPYVALATIRNRMRGPGEVRVEVSLRGEDGRVFSKSETTEIGGHGELTLTFEFPLPEGEYKATADVSYPP